MQLKLFPSKKTEISQNLEDLSRCSPLKKQKAFLQMKSLKINRNNAKITQNNAESPIRAPADFLEQYQIKEEIGKVPLHNETV